MSAAHCSCESFGLLLCWDGGVFKLGGVLLVLVFVYSWCFGFSKFFLML